MNKQRRYQLYALAVVVLIALSIVPFLVAPDAEFGGADGAGEEAIIEQNPGVEPIVEPLWEPPGETESMLFALQAALGAIFIGYFIGYEVGRKKETPA
jgi:cobalt/nickel transport protein